MSLPLWRFPKFRTARDCRIGISSTIEVWPNSSTRSSETLSFGPEIGVSRLYFWEERYIPIGLSARYRWETVWTWSVGGLVRLDLTPDYYVVTGAGIHTFFNGTGSTVGIPLGIGRTIAVNRFDIPLEFRVDIVFGDGVPIGLGGGVGLQFEL